MRLDRDAGARPGHMGTDQARVDRILEVVELVIEREGRVVTARADVDDSAAAEGQFDQELLRRPDPQLTRGDADWLPGRVGSSDRGGDLADHRRVRRRANVDYQYPGMDVRARTVWIRRRQDRRDGTSTIQVP